MGKLLVFSYRWCCMKSKNQNDKEQWMFSFCFPIPELHGFML